MKQPAHRNAKRFAKDYIDFLERKRDNLPIRKEDKRKK